MPSGRTKFNEGWLNDKDGNGDTLRKWCKSSSSEYVGHCIFCRKDISCENAGLPQLLQHAKTKKHLSYRKVVEDPKQSKFFSAASKPDESQSSASSSQAVTVGVSNHSSNVTKAESIWGLKVASSDFSYRSCDNLGETFSAMFQCPIATDFRISRTKVSYMISDGFGPYFTKQLVYDVNRSNNPFTIHYDETTTSQVKKQMDIHIRYWSESSSEVERKFYTSFMFGHAEGAKVADTIIERLESDGIHLNKLSSLASDGPNVNKTIFTAIDTYLKQSGFSGLVNIGSCNLHVIHNSFSKGLDSYSLSIDELAVDIHSFFKHSAARREDFSFYQLQEDVEEHVFIRHVPSRWVTLGVVVDRLVEQWNPLCKYFADLAKRDSRSTPKSASFSRISSKLQQKGTLTELHFLKAVIPCFQHFLKVFQTEAPLVHILYTEMKDLVVKLMSRFLKKSLYENKTGEELKMIDVSSHEHQLPDEDLVIGESTLVVLRNLEVGDKKRFLLSARKFYRTVVKYLLDRLPFNNQLLKDLACLHPSRKKDAECLSIQNVARKLPSVSTDDVTVITDEWRLYQLDDIEEDPECKEHRIDHYWRAVLQRKLPSGELKYENLQKVVKAALVLPHGNADCERGLSKNKKMLGTDRVNLSVKSIIGNRLAKDAVNLHTQPEKVPITSDMLQHVRHSHQRYQQRLEEEKQEEEARKDEAKRQLEEQERKERTAKQASNERDALNEKGKQLEKDELVMKKDLAVAEELLREGNEKLARALKNKDIRRASVAQSIIETAQTKITTCTKKLASVRSEQKTVEQKKRKNVEKLCKFETHKKVKK